MSRPRPTRLSDEQITALIERHPAWACDGHRLLRTVNLGERQAAVLRAIGQDADAADHHPIVTLEGSQVTFDVHTHTMRAVTDLDAQLIAAIDAHVDATTSGEQ
jgi:4a-hydroxytetrahydrobiopterin dehydratase